MKPFGMLRKNIGRLKPAILMFIFLFFTQGIAVTCSSILPETKSHSAIAKAQGAKSQSEAKKSAKHLASLRGSTVVTCSFATAGVSILPSRDDSPAFHKAIPARAPPMPFAPHSS